MSGQGDTINTNLAKKWVVVIWNWNPCLFSYEISNLYDEMLLKTQTYIQIKMEMAVP